MDIDIDKINPFEKINEVNTIKWRPIYEVIEEASFKEYGKFPDYFMKQCKINANEAQFIPLEVKNNIHRMAMEQILYAQVVKLRRKELKRIAENKNKNEAKFKFQGLFARSHRWFDLDFYWIEEMFSIGETDFYGKLFQSHDDTQDKNILKSFQVPIGNSKCAEKIKFHNDAPIIKYCRK